jgi:S1 RNA binding domain protein
MDLEVGAILTGKVTGITKFGAFVSLAPGKSGLVHISEIANTFVNDIHAHLTEGQEVTVKIIGIDDSGRINLSIKAAQPPQRTVPGPSSKTGAPPAPQYTKPSDKPSGDPSFEDKLKRFMQDSDSKISGIRQYYGKKNTRRKGGK